MTTLSAVGRQRRRAVYEPLVLILSAYVILQLLAERLVVDVLLIDAYLIWRLGR